MVKTQYINWLSSLHSSGIPEEFLMGFLNTNPSCTGALASLRMSVATFFGELGEFVTLLPNKILAFFSLDPLSLHRLVVGVVASVVRRSGTCCM
jgi:hypothetical protein